MSTRISLTLAFLFAVFSGGFATATDDGAIDIVQSMEEAREEEEGESARDVYLEEKYTAEETVIVRTPEMTATKTMEVFDDREPPPFEAVDLDAP